MLDLYLATSVPQYRHPERDQVNPDWNLEPDIDSDRPMMGAKGYQAPEAQANGALGDG